jgi:hypothetical protein
MWRASVTFTRSADSTDSSPSPDANLWQAEVDRVLKGKAQPSYADVRAMPYTMRCIMESMRLYPHPPVLIRRAGEADTLPGGWNVRKNQDVMISGAQQSQRLSLAPSLSFSPTAASALSSLDHSTTSA